MNRVHRYPRRVTMVAVVAMLVLVAPHSVAEGTAGGAQRSPKLVATVAVTTTSDFRVAIVARRTRGASTPTAEVRVGLARRIGDTWRMLGEKRLDESYFWHTVIGPRAVCRLQIATAGSDASFRPSVTVQLLLSPSLGCGRTYRIPLVAR